MPVHYRTCHPVPIGIDSVATPSTPHPPGTFRRTRRTRRALQLCVRAGASARARVASARKAKVAGVWWVCLKFRKLMRTHKHTHPHTNHSYFTITPWRIDIATSSPPPRPTPPLKEKKIHTAWQLTSIREQFCERHGSWLCCRRCCCSCQPK